MIIVNQPGKKVSKLALFFKKCAWPMSKLEILQYMTEIAWRGHHSKFEKFLVETK